MFITVLIFLMVAVIVIFNGKTLKESPKPIKQEFDIGQLDLNDYHEITKTKLSINDDLVKNLKYPRYNFINRVNFNSFLYQEFTVENMTRHMKMSSAAVNLPRESTSMREELYEEVKAQLKADGHGENVIGGDIEVYKGSDIRESHKSIFGPDVKYEDGDLDLHICANIYHYLKDRDEYIANISCGGDGEHFEYKTKIYDAYLEGDDTIYIHMYVQPFVLSRDIRNVYLYNREIENFLTEDYKIINYDEKISSSDLNSIVDKKMSEGIVDTYIFKFKKQSDGNFYIDSGKWDEFGQKNNELVYPLVNDMNRLGFTTFTYKDFQVDELSRDYLMLSAAEDIKITNYDNELGIYPVESRLVERNFKAMFGPDRAYENKSLSMQRCSVIGDYSESNRVYLVNTNCGAVGFDMKYITIFDKAEVKDDYIYTYFFVQPYLLEDYHTTPNGEFPKAYFYKRPIDNYLDKNDRPVSYFKEVDGILTHITTNELVNAGKVERYKFTFKKQSDGNYYIESRNWE